MWSASFWFTYLFSNTFTTWSEKKSNDSHRAHEVVLEQRKRKVHLFTPVILYDTLNIVCPAGWTRGNRWSITRQAEVYPPRLISILRCSNQGNFLTRGLPPYHHSHQGQRLVHQTQTAPCSWVIIFVREKTTCQTSQLSSLVCGGRPLLDYSLLLNVWCTDCV